MKVGRTLSSIPPWKPLPSLDEVSTRRAVKNLFLVSGRTHYVFSNISLILRELSNSFLQRTSFFAQGDDRPCPIWCWVLTFGRLVGCKCSVWAVTIVDLALCHFSMALCGQYLLWAQTHQMLQAARKSALRVIQPLRSNGRPPINSVKTVIWAVGWSLEK